MTLQELRLHIREVGARSLIRPSSNQLFLVYTGQHQRLMGDPAVFLSQSRLLERNVVMFRAKPGSFYHQGISASINSVESFVAWQRALCAEMRHIERVFCVGTSMGGYAALRFGYHLGVEAVWALSPQTLVKRLVRTDSGSDVEASDLAPLMANGNGRTTYHIYYNQSHDVDERAAQRLAGAPGVRLWPQGGEGHVVVKYLIESQQLSSIFPEPS